MKRNPILLALTLLLMLSAGSLFAQDGRVITLDNVTNTFDSGNKLIAGQTHVFSIRYSVLNVPQGCGQADGVGYVPAAGFVFTDGGSGAVWNGFTAVTTDAFDNAPDLIGGPPWATKLNHFEDPNALPVSPPLDGISPDAIQVVGLPSVFDPVNSWLAEGYDAISIEITLTSKLSDIGKTICVDSTGEGNIGTWVWGAVGNSACELFPAWLNTASTDQDPPYCFTIDIPPDFSPEVTNCPTAPISGNHCDVFTYDFTASDVEGTPISSPDGFVVVSGPGAGTRTGDFSGTWAWNTANLDSVGASIIVEVAFIDGLTGQQGPVCSFSVEVTNNGPSISCPSDVATVQADDSGTQQVTGSDADACDNLTYSITNDGGIAGTVGIDANGLVTFNPTAADAGAVTMTIEVTDGLESASCQINWNVIIGAPYAVSIACDLDNKALQGQFYTVAISLDRVDIGSAGGIGGYDLLISYDASAVSVQSVVGASDIAPDCWEYSTYRFSANGNCGGCPSGLLRLIGIQETNDGPAHPAQGCENYLGDLARITFLVSNDRTLECQLVPVRFYWVDCGDNVLSNSDGSRSLAHARVFDPSAPDPLTPIVDPEDESGAFWDAGHGHYHGPGRPGNFGVEEECISSDKADVERAVDFSNGCIRIVCGDEIDDRGDVNVNGLAYEIADAVMFTNYYIQGLSAFGPTIANHQAASIAASDVNADGLVLSVADLVYLVRVIVGDALPYPKVTLEAGKYTFNSDGVISVDGPTMGAAYLVIRGEVEPTLLSPNMDIKFGFDGTNTNILVYSLEAQGFTGDFLRVDGELLNIELAAYDGAPIDATMLPSDYALDQNYPNPFNPTTIIAMSLPNAGDYTLTIYNITGQVVAEFEGTADAGVVEIEWDASRLASGVYFYKMIAGEFTATKKAVLLK